MPEEKGMYKYKDEDGNEVEVEVKNIEFIYSVVREQLRVQFDTIDKVDQKASTLFGINSIVLSIVFTILWKHHNAVAFYSGVVFLFLSLVLLFFEYVTYKWRFDPKPQNFHEKYYGKSYNEAINKLTSNLVENYEKNEKIANRKADLFNWSLMLSIVGIFYIFLSIVI